MTKLHVAVDLDDVMLDFTRFILECWNREYGDYIPYSSVNAFHVLLDGSLGPTWKWLEKRDWLWAKVPAVRGAVGGVAQLRGDGHFVEGLTSKPEWAEWTVWAWCGKWRPEFNQLTVCKTGQKKHEMSPADVLVDDAVHNVNPWVATGRQAVLLDRPWNQSGASTGERLVRAVGWHEVLAAVREMSEPGDREYQAA